METLLLFVLPLLAVAMFALVRWGLQPSPEHATLLSEPKPFEGLFAPQLQREAIALVKAEAEMRLEQERAALLARAYLGDETSLDDAHATGDRELYNETLDALLIHANGSHEVLRSIAEYIVDSGGLRSTPALAQRMIDQHRRRLVTGNRALADLLYTAALSDDASIYEQAVYSALNCFREGRYRRLNPTDFIATVESGYWLISAEARYSGQGFTLKQMIAQARRELAAARRSA